MIYNHTIIKTPVEAEKRELQMNAKAKTSTHTAGASPSKNDNGHEGLIDCPVKGITVKTKFEPTHSQRELGSDAFSYYSNKFNLMKTLLLKDDDVQVLQSTDITSQGPATKRRKGSKAQPIPMIQDGGVRQTRLAFEVHPSLLIDDDIIRMLEQVDCAGISDDEEEEPNDEDSDHDAATNDEEEGEKESKSTQETLISLFLGDDAELLLDEEEPDEQL